MYTYSRNLETVNNKSISVIALMIISAAMSGCGESGKAAQASQLAVKVNSEDITVSQVNNALASIPVTPGKSLEDVRREVLENLVVQKLADQQAIKKKIDRTPQVMQAIENARNTILARAYMDPVVSGIAKPTAEEIHKFYDDHPELFSNRHIYSLRELEVESRPGVAASIREMAEKNESMDAISASLKTQNLNPAFHVGTKPAEQLPLEMLQRMSKLPAGKLMVVEMSNTVSVLQVVNAKAEPVKEEQAASTIQGYLANSRKQEALSQEIKSLKAAAKIEYFGEFKKDVNAAAETKPAKTEVAAVKTPAKPVEASSGPDLAKGVAGLK